METITIEQIDLIMERANVSYAEAKAALEQTNGDVVEALLLLEKDQKIKDKPEPVNNSKRQERKEKFHSFINKLNATSFILRKKEHTFINIPLSAAIILIALTFYVSAAVIILALLFGAKLEFKGENEVAERINSTLENISR